MLPGVTLKRAYLRAYLGAIVIALVWTAGGLAVAWIMLDPNWAPPRFHRYSWMHIADQVLLHLPPHLRAGLFCIPALMPWWFLAPGIAGGIRRMLGREPVVRFTEQGVEGWSLSGVYRFGWPELTRVSIFRPSAANPNSTIKLEGRDGHEYRDKRLPTLCLSSDMMEFSTADVMALLRRKRPDLVEDL